MPLLYGSKYRVGVLYSQADFEHKFYIGSFIFYMGLGWWIALPALYYLTSVYLLSNAVVLFIIVYCCIVLFFIVVIVTV